VTDRLLGKKAKHIDAGIMRVTSIVQSRHSYTFKLYTAKLSVMRRQLGLDDNLLLFDQCSDRYITDIFTL